MKKIILLLAVLSLIMVMSSCQKAEEVTVSKYFTAMQHNDKDTMAAMAYEPKRVDFKAYEILSIEEPVPQELQLTALIKAHGELEKKKKDLGLLYVDKGDILAEKEDELEETRRSSKRNQLKKEIEETKTEVADLETQIRSLQVEINGAKKAVEREKALISQSTNMTEGLEMFSGETINTKVTAKVTLKNDEVKNYIFFLRKDTLKLEDKQMVGRIIVIKLMAVEDYEKAMKEKEEKVEEKTEEVTEEAPVTEEKTTEEKTTEGGSEG